MKKVLYIIVIIATVTALPRSSSLYAQSPLEQRCRGVQGFLQNVQRGNDLRARVDRLQVYQYSNQRLDLFVTRLEKNGQPRAEQFRKELDSLEDSTDAFKRHYEAYDEARDAVSGLGDCSKKLPQFQQLLLTARDKRAVVYKDVVQIQNTHSGLLQQLTELKTELETSE